MELMPKQAKAGETDVATSVGDWLDRCAMHANHTANNTPDTDAAEERG